MNTMNPLCSVCGSPKVSVFLEIKNVPVHCNILCLSESEALKTPLGDIRLGFCSNCGHIFNLSFDPVLTNYEGEYENSLHFSPRFRFYAESLAARLIERYHIYEKQIMEIGCGNGDFLMLLCKLGRNRGVGFDPSLADDRIKDPDTESIEFIRDYYSQQYAGKYRADLICCRHVLEHIAFPRELLTTIRTAAVGTAIVFFEVPNAAFTMRDLGIWDVIYEHCSYFGSSSLAFLFRSCGFNVCSLGEGMEGQFLFIEALPDGTINSGESEFTGKLEDLMSEVKVFADRYRQKVEGWDRYLKDISNTGRKAVIWGGGSKGVTYLNILNARDRIEFVVDINPRKQGKFMPGTGQKIVSPDFLQEYRPDVVIVMNPVYTDEIKEMLRSLGINPHVVSA
jgi:hypothetical protein